MRTDENGTLLCSHGNCHRPIHAVTTGLCRTHHTRLKRGYPLDAPIRGDRNPCSHPGCGGPGFAKGYCKRHYHQYWRTGKTWGDGVGECSYQNCKRPVSNIELMLCQRHHANGGTRPIKGDRGHWVSCRFPGCDSTTPPGKPFCRSHRSRAAKYGLSDGEMLFLVRNGRCEACGSTTDLSVHHDHSCCPGASSCGDCVVAILCGLCNKSAGAVGDDPERLRRLAEVVEMPRVRDRIRAVN